MKNAEYKSPFLWGLWYSRDGRAGSKETVMCEDTRHHVGFLRQ